MAYVAVKGGERAIKEAAKLLEYFRCEGGSAPIEVTQILSQMRVGVDRVMSEGGIYSPELGALALKQAEGDVLEASFLLRAFPSTLERITYTEPVNTEEMRIIRRISGIYKDIPGGQFLGATPDYVKRLFRFSLREEKLEDFKRYCDTYEEESRSGDEIGLYPKVVDLLRKEGLLPEVKMKEETVDDITREAIRFPASRSAILQSLARGDQGGMMTLAYSSMRGYGDTHPYLAELRVGYVDVCIPHPFIDGEVLTIGEVLVTEVEMVASLEMNEDSESAMLSLGYGLCFGQNEVKAISMAVLDRCMQSTNPKAPAEDQEFVLYHIDGIEASGFTSHWKLPHYVDYLSDITRLRSIQKREVGSHERV